jgi:hypothetical protein
VQTMAPTRAAELHKCTVRMEPGPAAAPGIPCARIQFRADARETPVGLPGLADTGPPGGARDPGRACSGTVGGEYRSMAGPSGELGKAPGNPVELRSAGEPE